MEPEFDYHESGFKNPQGRWYIIVLSVLGKWRCGAGEMRLGIAEAPWPAKFQVRERPPYISIKKSKTTWGITLEVLNMHHTCAHTPTSGYPHTWRLTHTHSLSHTLHRIYSNSRFFCTLWRVWKAWSSCLYLPSAWVAGMCHHTWFTWFLGVETRALCMRSKHSAN